MRTVFLERKTFINLTTVTAYKFISANIETAPHKRLFPHSFQGLPMTLHIALIMYNISNTLTLPY